MKDVSARMGLADRRSQLAGQLSGGWKQRLALAACMLHQPKLLLLDEPTAGVDAKARREFWDMIHDLAGEGLTVLVSTHYMDEAERCHRIVYLANGHIVVQGDAGEVSRHSGLITFEVTGADVDEAARRLRRLPGVEAAAVFGRALHVAGTDRAALERAIRSVSDELPNGSALTWQEVEPRLEDVFIHMLSVEEPAGAVMIGFSLRRLGALMRKEWIQVTRDALTLRFIILVPVMQLFLFGFAINTNPKNLPTGLLTVEHSKYERTIVAALQNSGYYDDPHARLGDRSRARTRPGRRAVRHRAPAEFRPRGRPRRRAVDPDRRRRHRPLRDRQRHRGALDHRVGAQPRPAAGHAQRAARRPAFQFVVHARYNPEQLTVLNIVPGLMCIVLMMSTLFMTTLSITKERERGTMENLLAMPVRPLEVMLAKIMPYRRHRLHPGADHPRLLGAVLRPADARLDPAAARGARLLHRRQSRARRSPSRRCRRTRCRRCSSPSSR